MPENFRKVCAAALFASTVITIGVMWQPAYWATALPAVMAFCLASAVLVWFVIKGKKPRINLLLILLGVAALWPVVQLASGVTIYRWATSVAGIYWATCTAIVFIGLQIFGDPGVQRPYLRALAAAGLVLGILAPLQLFTSEGKIFWLFEVPYADVAMGPFVYGNQYAAFIELVLPVALTGILSDRGSWKTFHGLAAVVMYASVLASASRTGFILTSLEILFVPLLAARLARIEWRRLAIPSAMFLGMLVVLCLAIGPDRLIAKLQQKDPYRGRREFVESSVRMFRDKPVLGFGMGNWPTAYPAYAVFEDGFFANQAHNDWAQWAVEGGLPFVLIILAVACWAIPKALRTGWGTGICVVFLHCLIDYPIQRMGVAIIFFTLLAAIAYPHGRRGSEA